MGSTEMNTEAADMVVVHKHSKQGELPDSIEIGTPSRGAVKVYCDFDNMEHAIHKLDNAFQLLKRTREMAIEEGIIKGD